MEAAFEFAAPAFAEYSDNADHDDDHIGDNMEKMMIIMAITWIEHSM